MATTWGDLDEASVDKPVTLTLPWADEPVTYTLIDLGTSATTYVLPEGADDVVSVPGHLRTLDVPEWGGANPFILPDALSVSVGK